MLDKSDIVDKARIKANGYDRPCFPVTFNLRACGYRSANMSVEQYVSYEKTLNLMEKYK